MRFLLSLALMASLFAAGQSSVAGDTQITPCGSTSIAAPNGLIAIVPNRSFADERSFLSALNNPNIRGVALQIDWDELDPGQGQPEWSTLDARFSAAESSGKWLELDVFPGFFSPAWALQGVQSEPFAIPYGPHRGTVKLLPLPWDGTYLGRWYAFLRAVRDRYEKSPAFRMIAVAGPTSVSEEMTLPQNPQDIKKWRTLEYNPSRYIAAWQDAFREYAADFPNQCLALSVGTGLDINDRGKIDRSEGARTREVIITQAMAVAGDRFVLQNSDLHAGPGLHEPTAFVMHWIGRSMTGLEMRCPAVLGDCSEALGAAGDAPLALRKSIQLGMEPNAAGQHVNYLEIYEADVIAPQVQPVLRYGSSLWR